MLISWSPAALPAARHGQNISPVFGKKTGLKGPPAVTAYQPLALTDYPGGQDCLAYLQRLINPERLEGYRNLHIAYSWDRRWFIGVVQPDSMNYRFWVKAETLSAQSPWYYLDDDYQLIAVSTKNGRERRQATDQDVEHLIDLIDQSLSTPVITPVIKMIDFQPAA